MFATFLSTFAVTHVFMWLMDFTREYDDLCRRMNSMQGTDDVIFK
jgi:hypothetical protein